MTLVAYKHGYKLESMQTFPFNNLNFIEKNKKTHQFKTITDCREHLVNMLASH